MPNLASDVIAGIVGEYRTLKTRVSKSPKKKVETRHKNLAPILGVDSNIRLRGLREIGVHYDYSCFRPK